MRDCRFSNYSISANKNIIQKFLIIFAYLFLWLRLLANVLVTRRSLAKPRCYFVTGPFWFTVSICSDSPACMQGNTAIDFTYASCVATPASDKSHPDIRYTGGYGRTVEKSLVGYPT